jgi:GNAT superfamily N-acetyltransferase
MSIFLHLLNDQLTTMNNTDYYISPEPEKLNIILIHEYLSKRSFWARNSSFEDIERCLFHSMCFGIYQQEGPQVGFARVITDYLTYGHILDLFILESHRGLGLTKMLVAGILDHEDLQTIKKWLISTKQSHKVYQELGFLPLANPERLMELTRN